MFKHIRVRVTKSCSNTEKVRGKNVDTWHMAIFEVYKFIIYLHVLDLNKTTFFFYADFALKLSDNSIFKYKAMCGLFSVLEN